MMRRPTTMAVLGIAVGLFLASAMPSMAQSDADPVRARAFRVEYKPLGDAADVVAPLLSSEGTLTMRLRMRVLVVEDGQHPSRIALFGQLRHIEPFQVAGARRIDRSHHRGHTEVEGWIVAGQKRYSGTHGEDEIRLVGYVVSGFPQIVEDHQQLIQ